MNVLSLFDGISCGRVALERLGVKVTNYFASEIDPYAIQVAKKNFPDTIHVGDVSELLPRNLPKIDLLLGGSPCQGFSTAGKGLNFEDPRSRLFFEYLRLRNELRPDTWLFENVRMRKDIKERVSNYLKGDPIEINSALVSAQNRIRLYWGEGILKTAPQDKGISLNDILDEGWQSDRDKSYCIDANYGKGSNYKRYFFRSSRQIVFKKPYMPQVAGQDTANSVMKNDNQEEKKWRLLSIPECERLQTLPEGYVDDCHLPKVEKYRGLGNGWTVDVICHLLSPLSKRQANSGS